LSANFQTVVPLEDTPLTADDHAAATLNMLEDFSEDKQYMAGTQRAMFNILHDFAEDKLHTEENQHAIFNVLEDVSEDKTQMEATQHAMFNVLEDFSAEKIGLEGTQRAMLNLLEDFDGERAKAESASGELRESVGLLRVAKESAESSNRDLESFNYSVAHDLRAPLRHINGFAALLREACGSSLPPEAQDFLQRIQQGAQRMGEMVDALLGLGRVGRQGLNLRLTNLNQLVEEVISELANDIAGRSLRWSVAPLPPLECDRALMKQVFQNLLSNALKFTRSRSQVVIEIGQQDQAGTPVLFVRDNGVGFDMKYSDKLFGVFQRLHRVEEFEGTGIGLATVQRIVKKHQGQIWANAELDRGATFYFTLAASDGYSKAYAAVAGTQL